MAAKVWFITGSSRGFGRIWTEAALERGDRVAATARKRADLDDLVEKYGEAVLPLELDVTDRTKVFAAVDATRQKFGRLDVAINNAGYGMFGAIEEVSEAEARAQIETNIFGALWVLQAVTAVMRAQKSGHILSVSSIGGIVAFPNIGLYNCSKWGLEALNESLAQEVAAFGVHVTLIEPGGFATDWGGSSAKTAAPLPAYAELHEKWNERRKTMKQGDPAATAEAILKVVDSANPPLRLMLGSDPLPLAREQYEKRLATWNEWQPISLAAQGSKN